MVKQCNRMADDDDSPFVLFDTEDDDVAADAAAASDAATLPSDAIQYAGLATSSSSSSSSSSSAPASVDGGGSATFSLESGLVAEEAQSSMRRRRVRLETPSATAVLRARAPQPPPPRRSVRALVVAYTCVPLARLVRLVLVLPVRALIVAPVRALVSRLDACVPARARAVGARVLEDVRAFARSLLLFLSIYWAILVAKAYAFVLRPLHDGRGVPVASFVAGVYARIVPHADKAIRRRDQLLEEHILFLRKLEGQAYLGGCVVGVILFLALFVGVILVLVSDAHAHIDVIGAVQYARDGAPHVNFSARSLAITCHELRTGVFAVRGDDGVPTLTFSTLLAYSQYALQHESVACVCAPMFGKRRRHLALRLDNGTIMHLYNAEREASSSSPQLSLVSEHQRMMFPARVGSVKNVRADEVHVRYDTEECSRAALVLRAAPARCAQTCFDLFDGTTVYDRAQLHAVATTTTTTTKTTTTTTAAAAE